MFKLLYVPDDARFPVEVREAENWEDISWMVGGAIEEIHAGNWEPAYWQGYRNDDGVSAGLKYNSRATFLARSIGYGAGKILNGPVVFAGPEEPDGSFLTTVEPAVIAAASELGMEIDFGGNILQRLL